MTDLPRLSNATLDRLPATVARPAYDRSALATGIVHLGIGAFHRAHMAAYTDAVLADGDRRWGILGASLRSPDTRDALAPQDGLYGLAVRDAAGERLQVVGAVTRLLVAPETPERLLEAMSAAETLIVSLTVTEKGYCRASWSRPCAAAARPGCPSSRRSAATTFPTTAPPCTAC